MSFSTLVHSTSSFCAVVELWGSWGGIVVELWWSYGEVVVVV